MPTDTHKYYCRWPAAFSERRKFNYEAENRPYVESLRAQRFDGEEDEDKDENQNEDWDAESCNKYDEVELFVANMATEEDALHYRDQFEELVRLCKQGSFGNPEKSLALRDDRKDGGTIHVEPDSRRPYIGPLTVQQLSKELSKKVAQISCLQFQRGSHTPQRFRVESDPNVSTKAFEDEEIDAERRLM
jgi:hypothetical protein